MDNLRHLPADRYAAEIMKIAIVGLGYVGLPLCLQFARNDVDVIGLDIDASKVEHINAGKSYIEHIDGEAIRSAVGTGRLTASADFGRVQDVEAIIICVPTPLNKNREPDISYIIKTGEAIAGHLQKGTLVVLESTTYPGTTDEDLKQMAETVGQLGKRTEAEGVMSPNAAGKLYISTITLRPRISFDGPADLAVVDQVHHLAHDECYLAHSVRADILIQPR